MLKVMYVFQKVVAVALIVIMAVVIVLSTIDFGSIILTDILEHPHFLLDVRKLFDLLWVLITIIIAIELFDTVKIYFGEKGVKVEVVFLVAMMALAREVITLDIHKLEGTTLIGLAAIIGALSAGYFLVKHSSKASGEPAPGAEEETKKSS